MPVTSPGLETSFLTGPAETPTEESEELFGSLTAPINIEEDVLGTLRDWMAPYLADLEQKNGLLPRSLGRPPTPESFKGGLDWESVQEKYLPAVVVNANPTGEPERQAERFIQGFQVDVGCVIVSQEGDDPERSARTQAGLWAAAAMGAIIHHAGLGDTLIEQTVLTAAPKVEFWDTDNRRLAVGVTGFHVFAELIDSGAGPQTLKEVDPEGPYLPNPEVETVKETVTAKTVAEPV